MKASSNSNPMADSRASYSLQGKHLDVIVAVYYNNIEAISKGINNEQLKTAMKKTINELSKLTCRGSISPSYTSYILLVVSLLGGNRNQMTTNCENPQLRNAQLPDKAVTFCACANSYISCAWTFAGAFAYFCVYPCYFKTLTYYP